MLKKEDILNRLKNNKYQMEKLGISQIGLFGSYVQDNQNEDSDIDILIDFYEKDETFDNFMNICEVLENLFKDKKVDVITKNGLSEFIKPYILKEVEYV